MSLEDIFWEGATLEEKAALEAAEATKYGASCVVEWLEEAYDSAEREIARIQRELDKAREAQQKAAQRLRELEIEIGNRIIARKTEGTHT